MSICTASQAVAAMKYWDGYYEKSTSKYASYRDKKYFDVDRGSANYTYPGYFCGIQGGAWCAMTVSTAICEACGGSKADAKTVMHGVWPYTACNQLYDAAPSGYKGRRGSWTPIPGDVIVFSSNGSTREHTGMVIEVNGNQIKTQEGNKSNMCKVCTYSLSDSYIYGYVRPKYADAQSGSTSSSAGSALTKGSSGSAVTKLQKRLIELGYNCGSCGADGDFGASTLAAVKAFQKANGLTVDGIAGAKTQSALYNSNAVKYGATSAASPSSSANYPTVKYGANGPYTKKIQQRLNSLGYNCGQADGVFGSKTLAAVKAFQRAKGLAADGVVGPKTWAKLGIA